MTSVVRIQLFKVYNFRFARESVVKAAFAERWLDLAITWEFALLLVIVYLPVIHEPFDTLRFLRKMGRSCRSSRSTRPASGIDRAGRLFEHPA